MVSRADWGSSALPFVVTPLHPRPHATESCMSFAKHRLESQRGSCLVKIKEDKCLGSGGERDDERKDMPKSIGVHLLQLRARPLSLSRSILLPHCFLFLLLLLPPFDLHLVTYTYTSSTAGLAMTWHATHPRPSCMLDIATQLQCRKNELALDLVTTVHFNNTTQFIRECVM